MSNLIPPNEPVDAIQTTLSEIMSEIRRCEGMKTYFENRILALQTTFDTLVEMHRAKNINVVTTESPVVLEIAKKLNEKSGPEYR